MILHIDNNKRRKKIKKNCKELKKEKFTMYRLHSDIDLYK